MEGVRTYFCAICASSGFLVALWGYGLAVCLFLVCLPSMNLSTSLFPIVLRSNPGSYVLLAV